MTATEGPESGGPDLVGCPAEASVRWAVEHMRRDAPVTDGATLLRHLDVEPLLADVAAEHLPRAARAGAAVDEVLSWRATADGRVVIRYLSAEGRAHEVSWRVTHDGRLSDQIQQRADTEAVVSGHRTADLTAHQRSQVHAVFAAAYDDADPHYLDDQLRRLQGIGIASEPDGAVIGFTLYGWRELDLPRIGVQGVCMPGLACADPQVRRKGIASACGNAAALVAVQGPFHLAATKLATPASLRMMLRAIPTGSWPTAEDPFALQRHPTATQRLVTEALALALGCAGAEGAVGIGHGQPIGRPKVAPEVTPEESALFEPVDRTRGDTLLWVAWAVPPPPAWYS